MANPNLLPLPEPAVLHHGQTLFGPMMEWLSSGRIPPVLMITGPAGVGKRSVTYFLAQWILCEAGPSLGVGDAPRACGACSACQRALHGNWVDFREILPEEDGGTLKIEQFRDLKASLGFGAHEGRYKITVIPNADRMTAQAANSVLKLLEEPPQGWLFLLTASDPTLVLPTILSRCQRLRLKPFELPVLRELLAQAGVAPERRESCARLAEGSWGKALTLAGDEHWEQRQEVFEFLGSPQARLNGLVEWASQEPSKLLLLIDQLEGIAADLIRWSVGPPTDDPEHYPWAHAANSVQAKALAKHAASVSKSLGTRALARAFWTARAERLGRARQEALAPLNKKLLAQDLLLPWLEAGHR